MIQAIGLMIGAYVITRMVSFLTRKGDRAETAAVKVLAIITILVAAVCVADLLLSGQRSLP